MRFVTTARSAVYYAKATLITKFLSAGDAIDVPFAVVGAGTLNHSGDRPAPAPCWTRLRSHLPPGPSAAVNHARRDLDDLRAIRVRPALLNRARFGVMRSRR